MRSGKSRHKLLAVEFLSNISLDGTRRSAVVRFGEPNDEPKAHGTGYPNTSCSLQALRSETHAVYVPSGSSSSSSRRTKFQQLDRSDNFNRTFRAQTTIHEHPSELSNGYGNRTSHFNRPTADKFDPASPPTSLSLVQSPSKNCSGLDSGYHDKFESKVFAKDHDDIPKDLSGKRLNLCFAHLDLPLVVFTINPTKRTTSDTGFRRKPTRSTCKTVAGDTECEPAVASSSSRGVVLLGANDVDPISSHRPIGDTVQSYASMLHPFCSTIIPMRIYLPHSALGPDSSSLLSDPNLINLIQSFSAYRNSGQLAAILMQPHIPSFSNAHRASLTVVRMSTNNAAIPTTFVTTSSSPISGTSVARIYIDPLICYSPNLLDDPDLLVVTGKRIFPMPNYLTSVLTYVRPTEQKRNVNREFHERFPMVHLTLTKLRSIKSVLVQITVKLSFDLWIAAHAHVLFEKLVLKLFVNKTNRRACASGALLVSAKLNDIKGQDLDSLFQELENGFRISHRDILSAEIDICLGLEFCLIPPEIEIGPHYIRIHRALDIPPCYLMPPHLTL